jgi:hypothetical protein
MWRRGRRDLLGPWSWMNSAEMSDWRGTQRRARGRNAKKPEIVGGRFKKKHEFKKRVN